MLSNWLFFITGCRMSSSLVRKRLQGIHQTAGTHCITSEWCAPKSAILEIGHTLLIHIMGMNPFQFTVIHNQEGLKMVAASFP